MPSAYIRAECCATIPYLRAHNQSIVRWLIQSVNTCVIFCLWSPSPGLRACDRPRTRFLCACVVIIYYIPISMFLMMVYRVVWCEWGYYDCICLCGCIVINWTKRPCHLIACGGDICMWIQEVATTNETLIVYINMCIKILQSHVFIYHTSRICIFLYQPSWPKTLRNIYLYMCVMLRAIRAAPSAPCRWYLFSHALRVWVHCDVY